MSISLLHFEIATDHPCLPGHFPGQPVVPGVVVLDRVFAAIESAIVAAIDAQPETQPLQRVRLPQVKFVQPLLPRQPARVELQAISAPGITSPSDASMTNASTGAETLNDAPSRWRFKVLREADDALIASGEVQILAQAPAA